MLVEQDPYKVLSIEPSANANEIKTAFRKLALRYHPDINNDPTSNEKMRQIIEAFDILSNDTKRKEYDILKGHVKTLPKFTKNSKVRVNFHSKTPFKDHIGVVEKEPVWQRFRFWYLVRFESESFSTLNNFAEEELSDVNE